MRKSNSLLWAVLGTVVVGVITLAGLAFAAWYLGWEGFWRGAGQPYATTLAALAAITAAAIALHNHRSQLDELRAQRDQDQLRWEDQRRRDDIKDLRTRFSEATRQLADSSPAVRRSGAYAMAALADDWNAFGDKAEMTICMGVLAAYVAGPNPTYTELTDGDPEAGEDGPVRALIVSLLSKYAGRQFRDIWGNYTLLHYADLRGVRFTAPINNAELFRAYVSYADFRRAPFMETTNLSGADLTGADLRQTNLRRAELMFADLTSADLRGADLCGANLMGATLEKVKWDTLYDKQTRWPEGFEPPPHPLGVVPEHG